MTDPVEQADALDDHTVAPTDDNVTALPGDAAARGEDDDAAAADEPVVLGGRYLLEERIASGGMASVWRAHDELLARTVAVKILHDHLAADEAFRERFRREAVSAAKLSHPNIVSLYDTGADGVRVYLVMEFVDGSTLKDVVADLGGLEPDQVAAIGEKVARALAYAHQRGLVHRDVKPANILIGGDGTVKVADFGIAKAEEADDGLTKTGMVLGTAAYVAPEQILSQPIDGRTDQYALGIVLYEALTSRQPFKGDSPVATAALRLEQQPLPVRSLRADCPRGLDAVIMRALARDPADRFASADAFADGLSPWAGTPDDGRTAALVTTTLVPSTGTGRPGPGAAGAAMRTGSDVPAATRAPGFLRTEGRWLAPVIGLLALAAALVGVGLASGVLESGGFPIRLAQDRDRGGDQGDERAPTEGVQSVPVAGFHAFDPPPGDLRENDGNLPAMFDGDPATTWRTELYNNASFGGLKDGVGFWVDLGAPQRVEAVQLRTTTPGIALELRVAEQPADSPAGWAPVAAAAQVGDEIDLRPAEPVLTQFLLVWITGDLQPRSGRFTAEFSTMTVLGEPA